LYKFGGKSSKKIIRIIDCLAKIIAKILSLRKFIFMRKFILLLIILHVSIASFSQEYKSNIKESERIKNDTCFYWYQGNGDFETIDDAEDDAVSGLLENVKKIYKSNIVAIGNDNANLLNCVFETFKPFIEQNIQYLTLKSGTLNEVFAYISKASFRDACNERRNDIDYYVRMADTAMDKENVGDALRYYYIAMMLCYSHPDGNNLIIKDEENERNVKMVKWLSNMIDGDDGILNSVRFNTKNWYETDEKVAVELFVSTDTGIPVSNVSFKYNNGRFNQTCNVSNGRANVEIVKNDGVAKDIDVEIDMSYDDVEFEEPTAFAMMKYLRKKVGFSKTAKSIANRSGKGNVKKEEQKNEEQKKEEKKKTIVNEEVKVNSIEGYIVRDNSYIVNMKFIENAIRLGEYESVSHLFSSEGYEFFLKLKNYGKASVIGFPDYKMYEFNGEVICRSLPMRFSFNNLSFTRDVVFRFDKETKKVTSIAFRLSDTAEKCVWDNEEWKVDSRLVLINFLEDYQTAYAFKQLDYLDKIFSDNALIIVGHVIENKPVTQDGIVYGNNIKIERTKKSKSQYLQDLGRQFRSKSYINIHFTDLDVRRAAGKDEEVFGVQVRQYYHSSNYNDEGYLFLMVDLREELPIIHVRTWQPGKTDIEDLITLKDVL